jgi:hypothetical protein
VGGETLAVPVLVAALQPERLEVSDGAHRRAADLQADRAGCRAADSGRRSRLQPVRIRLGAIAVLAGRDEHSTDRTAASASAASASTAASTTAASTTAASAATAAGADAGHQP